MHNVQHDVGCSSCSVLHGLVVQALAK